MPVMNETKAAAVKMMNANSFEMLQDREEKAFYTYTHNPTAENKEAHNIAKANLIAYAKANGII